MKRKLGSESRFADGRVRITIRSRQMYGLDEMKVLETLSKYELMGIFSDAVDYLEENPDASIERLLAHLRKRAQENEPWLEQWLRQ